METHNENHDNNCGCEKKKKGILAMIWESLVKTGGCCGSGESCCGKSSTDTNKPKTDTEDANKTG